MSSVAQAIIARMCYNGTNLIDKTTQGAANTCVVPNHKEGEFQMATSDSTISLKRCSICGLEFPATTEFFYRNHNGLRADCKNCRRAYDKRRYDRVRDHRLLQMRQRFWHDYRGVPWAWCVTIQGWHVEDYIRHARELRPLIKEMQAAGSSEFRVGIGTLCRRASARMIQQVIQAVTEQLPGVPLHLWGVKLLVLQSSYALPQVVSVDSAAWDQSGMWRDGIRTVREQKALGMTQKEYAHLVALPRYREKVEAALASEKTVPLPRQRSLWEVF